MKSDIVRDESSIIDSSNLNCAEITVLERNGKYKTLSRSISKKLISNGVRKVYKNQQESKKTWIGWIFNELTFTLLLFVILPGFLLFKDGTYQKAFPSLDFNIKDFRMHLHRYSWFFKAAASGASVTGITWIIIYHDSFIPGIDPPLPFGSKKGSKGFNAKISESFISINYFVGMLNGLLIFVYMCL